MNEMSVLASGMEIVGYVFFVAIFATMVVGEWKERQKARRRERELAKIDPHELFLGIGAAY